MYFVFGGKCKFCPRDFVSLCVTSPRRRESRACGEIAYNFDEKESFGFPYHCTVAWKKLAGIPRGKRRVANSGTHGELAMKAFRADDGLF